MVATNAKVESAQPIILPGAGPAAIRDRFLNVRNSGRPLWAAFSFRAPPCPANVSGVSSLLSQTPTLGPPRKGGLFVSGIALPGARLGNIIMTSGSGDQRRHRRVPKAAREGDRCPDWGGRTGGWCFSSSLQPSSSYPWATLSTSRAAEGRSRPCRRPTQRRRDSACGHDLAGPARAGPWWPILPRKADDELHPEAAGAAPRRGTLAQAGPAPHA